MHVDEDVTRELVRQFFKLGSIQQKAIRKCLYPPELEKEGEKVVCVFCDGEGEIREVCSECEGSGWLEECVD